jgi:hypothetical protein
VDNVRKWNCWIRNDDNEQLLKPKRRTQTHPTRPEEEEKTHNSKILPQKSFTKLCPGRRRRRRRPSRSRNRFQDLDADGGFWGPESLWDLTFWFSTLQLYVNQQPSRFDAG